MVTNETMLAARQLKKQRSSIFAAGLVLGLAAIIACMLLRWPIPMYTLGVLWVIGCIALGTLWVSPAVWYARYQQDVAKGRHTTINAVFEGAAPKASVRNHLDVLEMRFSNEVIAGHPRDAQQHVVYWDVQNTPPQLEIGQRVQLTTYEYWIVAVKPIENDPT